MKEKRKLFGPKLKPYFRIHIKCMRTEIIVCLIIGLIAGFMWGEFGWNEIILMAVFITGYCFAVFRKTCFRMLYQQEAYLYQSFPVSAFETVFTKVVTGAIIPSALLVPALILMYGTDGLILVPAVVTGSLLTGSMILKSIDFGNVFRDNRMKKPNALASIIMGVLTMAVILGTTMAVVMWTPLTAEVKILIITLMFAVSASGSMYADVRSLQKGYHV